MAGLEPELLRQHRAEHVGRPRLQLQPHDRVDRALIELFLDRLEQVARAGLLELEIARAGDAEESDLLDPAARVERREVGRDDLLDGHQVPAVRQLDEPGQRGRQPQVGEVERPGGLPLKGHGHRQRERRDERKGMPRAHRDGARREHREEFAAESRPQHLALV